MRSVPSGRRARRHDLAKHPIQSAAPMDSLSARSGDTASVAGPARSVDHRGFQIWDNGFGSSPEQVVDYIMSTTIVDPHPSSTASRDPLLSGIRDAADECEHGRLPGDRSDPCGCWGS